MRTPSDLPQTPRAPRRRGRARWWIIGAIVIFIIVLTSLKSLATLYTDALWFSSVHQHPVWTTLLAVKVGLFASFGFAFFGVLWVNLMISDRLASDGPALDPEDELVRRYRQVIRPYAGRAYAALAFVLALIAASGTIGQWNNWILFRHGVNFAVKDPQFGRDIGFFVFKLPFIMFIINWSVVSLIVILVLTTIFHYLNGGIRAQRTSFRINVRSTVKVHLSVLLALIALGKAAGYYFQRYQLDVSQNGYVNGASYTDVHARLPAMWLLFYISLAAAAVLLYNIRRKGWTLPVLAVGVWAFVALVAGIIYPAILQAVRVSPNQSTLELPYIQRNIAATRTAYNLNKVSVQPFNGTTTLNSNTVPNNQATLNNIRLWDPDPSISLQTFQKLQSIKSYYQFMTVGVDRYPIDGNETPTVVGVRQINSSALNSPSWVNTHLQYTHGIGAALAPANSVVSNGTPNYSVGDVPPTSSGGAPAITQPGVYFGLGQPGYVVADTKQNESITGVTVDQHYQGNGGVKLNSFLARAAFFVRLGDFNLLISNLITPQSQIMFVRDVQAMAQKAAPFLSFDADPYAAIVNGHVDWILDAYTTTSQYPYSQNASNFSLPQISGLPGSFNYVRNSVKVVIDAYSGQMTFYAMDQSDPILRTYEAGFPQMFTPASKIGPALRAHLRYPEDIFSTEAAVLGRYHIVNASDFYQASNAWSVSPSVGAGPPAQSLAVTLTTNAAGQQVTGPLQPMAPIYQVLQVPNQSQQSFTITDAYVPFSGGNGTTAGSQNLTGFLMGQSDPGQYGRLTLFETPAGQSVTGPAQANSEMQENSAVSQEITYLDQHGSQVLLGNVLMIPIDQSILYVRPLYVTSTSNTLPKLNYVIAVFGSKVGFETTEAAALTDVLGSTVSTGNQPPPVPSSGGTASSAAAAQAQADLKQANTLYQQAQTALTSGTAGNLGAYQSDIDQMEALIQKAEQLLTPAPGAPSTAPTSSTSTTRPKSTTRTTTKTTSKSSSTTSTTSHA